MAAQVNFKEVYEEIKQALLREREGLKNLGLASVFFGDDQTCQAYILSQQKLAQELKVDYKIASLPQDASLHEAVAKIESLNKDKTVSGIIINRPFPSHIEVDKLLSVLDYRKDIEGLHPDNLGRLMESKALFISPTVRSSSTFRSSFSLVRPYRRALAMATAAWLAKSGMISTSF